MANEDLEEQIEDKKEQIAQKKREKREAKKAQASGGPVLDPMIVDPAAEQQEKFEGTTSDASTHVEGTSAADVPPDPNTNPDKATDAENYDFPPAGDVDISTVDPGGGEGEVMPKPTLEDWVVLDGTNDAVPDALDGRRAVILAILPDQEFYTPEEWDEVSLTVRTRDDYGATLSIPTDAVKQLQRGGLNPQKV